MSAKEIIGKKVIDMSGKEVGKIEDIKIDIENSLVTGIVIEGEDEIKEKVMSRLGRFGIGKETPDIEIPLDKITAIGEVVILSIKVEESE